jgi:hypothetical protein
VRLKSAAAKAGAAKKKKPAKKKKGGGGGGGGGMRAQSGKAAAAKKAAAKAGPSTAAQTPRQQAAKYLAAAVKETARAAAETQRAKAEDARAAAQDARAERDRRAAMIAGDNARGRELRGAQATALVRAANDRQRAQKERTRAKHAKALAAQNRVAAHDALIGAPSPGAVAAGWILGWNDDLDTCAAAALANSLLACTGHRAADRDVLDLHLAVTRGAGQLASMSAVLAAARERGISGWHPAVTYQDVPAGDGAIVTFPGHAAVWYGQGLVSWGQHLPADAMDGPPGGGWEVQWVPGSHQAGP